MGKKETRQLPLVGIGMVSISIFLLLIAGIYLRGKLVEDAIWQNVQYSEYEKHYAFVTENRDSPFLSTIYTEIKEAGIAAGRYVEYVGKSLPANYDVASLLKIAIDCKVDGIILEAKEDETVERLINQAVERGIPVITLLVDSPKSSRQSFVGINNYHLGKLYGELIGSLILETEEQSEPMQICVLMDEESTVSSQNIIYTSIKESLQSQGIDNQLFHIEPVGINNENIFSSEEAIRDIVLNNAALPDMLVCLSDVYTRCSYQAVVDHNKVGRTKILGYHDDADTLAAIQKEIIYSTIAIDTKEMGEVCIQALIEYEENGRMSEYLPVNIEMITLENIAEYAGEVAKERASSNLK